MMAYVTCATHTAKLVMGYYKVTATVAKDSIINGTNIQISVNNHALEEYTHRMQVIGMASI